jgi:hypothetical protein
MSCLNCRLSVIHRNISFGQVGKAVELLEHVVKVKGRTLAEERLSRLVSRHALAGAYQARLARLSSCLSMWLILKKDGSHEGERSVDCLQNWKRGYSERLSKSGRALR